jgi:hypothetical protein
MVSNYEKELLGTGAWGFKVHRYEIPEGVRAGETIGTCKTCRAIYLEVDLHATNLPNMAVCDNGHWIDLVEWKGMSIATVLRYLADYEKEVAAQNLGDITKEMLYGE